MIVIAAGGLKQADMGHECAQKERERRREELSAS